MPIIIDKSSSLNVRISEPVAIFGLEIFEPRSLI